MAKDDSTILLVGIAAVISLIGVALAASSVATHRSFGSMMGGGMMNGTTVVSDPGPGGLEWGILVASAVLFLGALFVYYRARSEAGAPPLGPAAFAAPVAAAPTPPSAPAEPPHETVAEPTLVRLLDDDERRMYLEIREHGGEMLQRDLVALGTFSKAKVTRVLDKLEMKGLVVRERHGMTNRVRLASRAAK